MLLVVRYGLRFWGTVAKERRDLVLENIPLRHHSGRLRFRLLRVFYGATLMISSRKGMVSTRSNFASDPEGPAIFQEAGLIGRPQAAELYGRYDA